VDENAERRATPRSAASSAFTTVGSKELAAREGLRYDRTEGNAAIEWIPLEPPFAQLRNDESAPSRWQTPAEMIRFAFDAVDLGTVAHVPKAWFACRP
jgi:hypothetical protein